MGHAQKSPHSILGRDSLVTLGWAHVDQLRRTLRRWHGAALARGVPRRREQRRVAHRRHHYRGARSPLRRLHAQLSESYSARSRCHPSRPRNDRTVLLRSNLRRLVAGKRIVRRKSCGVAIGAALSPRDRGELRLSSSHTLALVSALEIASAGLFVIIRSNLEKSAARQAVNPRNFFSELKRRNVYKVAIAYGVVAWLLLQAASIL